MAKPYGLMLRRGLCKRCPICGQGKLFRRWVVMVDDCPRCGLHFHRADGQWVGSWFVNIFVGETVVLAVFMVGVLTTFSEKSPPMLQIGVLAGVAAVAVPFLFFPFARTIWTAIDLMVAPLDLDEGVAPGFELDLESPPARAGHDGSIAG